MVAPANQQFLPGSKPDQLRRQQAVYERLNGNYTDAASKKAFAQERLHQALRGEPTWLSGSPSDMGRIYYYSVDNRPVGFVEEEYGSGCDIYVYDNKGLPHLLNEDALPIEQAVPILEHLAEIER